MNQSSRPRSRARVDRKYSVNLWGRSNSPFNKRKNPMGQHGGNIKRRVSLFGQRLLARQRIRSYYNISETQLKNTVLKAYRNRKVSRDIAIFAKLGSRLDQIVYQLSFAPSIFSARQLVSHKHFLVNGKRVNIPSMMLRAGDVVSVNPKSRNIFIIESCASKESLVIPPYLKRIDNFSGTMVRNIEHMNDLALPFEPNPLSLVETYKR